MSMTSLSALLTMNNGNERELCSGPRQFLHLCCFILFVQMPMGSDMADRIIGYKDKDLDQGVSVSQLGTRTFSSQD